MAQQQRHQQQEQQQRRWWQQDDIYGVTPQHTGASHASRSRHSREGQVEEGRPPPLPPRRSTASFQQPWQQDDIYGVTPQHTGATQLTQRTQPSPVRTRDGGSGPSGPCDKPPPVPDKVPPLPPRKSATFTVRSEQQQQQQQQRQQQQYHHHQQQHHHHQPWNPPDRAPPPPPPHPATTTHQRSKEHVVAFMIPLPLPLGPDGLPLAIPQRYMLYLPPAPDLLKPEPASSPADGGGKERKRDRAHRRWQEEVRKAKTYSGAVVTMRGLYSASVRGAVYVLSMLQRSELTFLSRLPRRTLRELELMHPAGAGAGAGAGDEERFAEVRAELERNRRVARRDFWIAAALLPFATAVDLAIPVFGGLSEVDLVWMVVTGRAWMAARGVARRLVLAPGAAARALSDGGSSNGGGGAGGMSGYEGDGTPPYQCAGALGGHGVEEGEDDSEDGDNRHPPMGYFTEHLDEEEHPLFDGGDDEKQDGRDGGGGGGRKHRLKKEPQPPVEMSFRPSTSMAMVEHYVRAACHARNARLFPDVGAPEAEAEVLRSMGWTPERGRRRAAEEDEADVAWQVRKASDDLRAAAAKAAKTWDKQCRRFAAEDAERALGAAGPRGEEGVV